MTDKFNQPHYKLLLLFAVVIAGYFGTVGPRYTVSQGQQDTGLGRAYGYRVENYRFQDRMRITIWVRAGKSPIIGYTYLLKSVYDLPSLSVDKVEKSQWIKSNGAIYLSLEITYHDSLESTNPTRIIYDFHTGEMYITSELTLWRIRSEELGHEDWLTEREFDQMLSELQK